ncbi:class I SAM-dependent methyltransferase [Clostridium saccharobutylicum]|uniref:Methyltransferase family protein n=1 Tax=Clostridium saccharobutylicum DSM 13864 TaxID=1345695 RepID=U5MPM7_CLOSA|nr:class I SAM-dependent methyltransferase [Clostridium saccharobutylicum]AGX42530.1 methyltransferase family protein [Clostridium saccharobutylicum DSM 13864]AQR89816.1 glycine/sarcosine N-methyltransferase [Clostridium saccharobutylicum]AQR99718.1 glycine/sarcosine N-methyltransferase [Clostridium saccharobutylicum]AQS09448.1 glycine/sarcosine N-methyltransferase [Clostridium saccharobutylicum]AQS13704.1 glycine/sarcosine N-methyltransferase [Clostridium saccharobutylicum]
MEFYNELSKYYNDIFPPNTTTLTFLLNHLKNRDSILDVACGSGEYTIQLTQNNYNVIGVDLEKEMIKKAKDKAKRMHLNINFQVANMLSLKENFKENDFSGIFCIGNSLVHLKNIDEIYVSLKDMYNLLKHNGNLIIQIINYDRILNHDIKELPTIKNDEAGIEFIRQYEKENNRILFNTILKTRDNQEFKNTVSLLPLTSSNLISIIRKCGFRDVHLYGRFNGCAFNKDKSLPIILVCKK